MSKAKFTLIGCFQFFHNAGDDLFKNLSMPEGINTDTLASNILFRGGEFEVMYSDPFTLQNMIDVWSKKNAATFKRWVDALAIEYSPLENYDRMETWTDTGHVEGSTTSEGSNDTTTGGNTQNEVSAYDSATYSPHDKSTTTGTTSIDTEDSVATETDSSNTRTGRAHGNIGVTTSQQMLVSELDLGYWNLYDRITELFLSDFVIPVYE